MSSTMYSVSVHNPMSAEGDSHIWDGERLNEKEIIVSLLSFMETIHPTDTLVITITKTVILDKKVLCYDNYEIKCEYHTDCGMFFNWSGNTDQFGKTPHNITSHLNQSLVTSNAHLKSLIEDNKPCRVITDKGELKVFEIIEKEGRLLTECGEQFVLQSCPIREVAQFSQNNF